MRVETSGELRRLDLAPLIELLPPLWDEWANLQFDRQGALVNPRSGVAVDGLELLSGRHRQNGAVYRATISTPKLEVPEARQAEFAKEADKLSRRRASQEQWAEHLDRKRAASVQVGVDHEHVRATLIEDSSRALAFSAAAEGKAWTLDIEVLRQRLPRIKLDGRIDLTATLKSEGSPGCIAALFGGTGRGTADIDLEQLDNGGKLVDAEGRANRLRGDARIEVRPSLSRWKVEGCVGVRARGLARPLLWFGGGRLRRGMERSYSEAWASSDQAVNELAAGLEELRTSITVEGGAAPFVHRALWDDDFDGGLDRLRIDRKRP
jgi:hypothetical protein